MTASGPLAHIGEGGERGERDIVTLSYEATAGRVGMAGSLGVAGRKFLLIAPKI